ncbi:MAG: DnaJ domain-containing protein [Clostridiaceae bacterium]|jgi:DnaJ-class molecular chaperone|nr:DnaJ domain-containing protein [Clostridiaceae bacterium]
MIKNYYDILGVSIDCGYADIKSAYRKLARKYHPDLNKDNIESALKHFKEISQAYETLSDPKRRTQYDILNGIFKTGFGTNFSEFEQDVKTYSSPYKKTEHTKKETTSDLKDKINDMFEEFKREKSKKYKQEKLEPKKGSDINVDVTISLNEVASGCKKSVNIVHTENCPNCHGRKFINGSKCKICDGKGETSEHKKITVTIPQGVKNHTKLRVKEEGNAGFNGGKSGDLYINVTIAPNSNINFDGANIIYHVPISPFEAVLGGDILVPTYDGNVLVKVPPKTNSGQKFRLSGLGAGKNGDMIIIVDIEISKSLSDDEIKLYEKLKKLNKDNLRENILND